MYYYTVQYTVGNTRIPFGTQSRSKLAVSGMYQWEVLCYHQSVLWRLRLICRDANLLRQYSKNQSVSLPTQASPVQQQIYSELHLLWIFQSVMLWPPIRFWPTNQKVFSGFAGFNIDDITRFFTLAGNVLQHIWQSFSLSAPSPIVSMTLCIFLASSSLAILLSSTRLCLPLSLSFYDSDALGPSCSHRAPRYTQTEQRGSLCTRAGICVQMLQANADGPDLSVI